MNFIESMDKDNYGWTQNVNVARFARNVEWDLFYDFQTLCILWKIIIHRLFVEFNLPVEFSLLLVDEFNLDFTFFNKTANFPHFFSCNLCDHLVKVSSKAISSPVASSAGRPFCTSPCSFQSAFAECPDIRKLQVIYDNNTFYLACASL